MEKPDGLFLHADGDSFFAACELVLRPELRGKSVVVGEDRGIAVAMTTEAKKLGVTRGMPVFEIQKKFPEVVILPHTFGLYKKISQHVYEILLTYMAEVERYSIDECFAFARMSDIRYAGDAKRFIKEIQDEIWQKAQVPFSVGLARTKTLAKTASKLEKPRGLVALISKKDEERALKNTAIEDVWGIGRRTVPRLYERGIKTAYDFIRYPREEIEKFFSEPLVDLHRELSGEAVSTVTSESDPRDQKSIQSTATFKPSSSDVKIIWAELALNVENACEHARELGLLSNSVSFFVKNTDFEYRGKEKKLTLYSADPGVILNTIEPLFYKILKKGEKIRSTGISLHNLARIEDVPRDLFGRQDSAIDMLRVEKAADSVRAKYGQSAVKRVASLRSQGKNRGNSFPGSV